MTSCWPGEESVTGPDCPNPFPLKKAEKAVTMRVLVFRDQRIADNNLFGKNLRFSGLKGIFLISLRNNRYRR